MTLTVKQEGFCNDYVATGNASEAYRRNYSHKNMAENSINVNAHKLLKNTKILQRVEKLRESARTKAVLTLESHLSRLEELSIKAEQEGQFSAAITAEVSRGKVAGLYTEKVEHSGEVDMNLKINVEFE